MKEYNIGANLLSLKLSLIRILTEVNAFVQSLVIVLKLLSYSVYVSIFFDI